MSRGYKGRTSFINRRTMGAKDALEWLGKRYDEVMKKGVSRFSLKPSGPLTEDDIHEFAQQNSLVVGRIGGDFTFAKRAKKAKKQKPAKQAA